MPLSNLLMSADPKTPQEAGEILRTAVARDYPQLARVAFRFTRENWPTTNELAEEVFATPELRGVVISNPARLLRERWRSPKEFLEEVYGSNAGL